METVRTNGGCGKHFRTALTLLAICLFTAAGAQPRVLTLEECRNLALNNNKLIKVADESIIGADYLHKAAKTAYLPGVDFGMTYFYNQHKIALLGEDAKLPTMTFDPATQSYQYNLVKNPMTGEPIKDPQTGSFIPSEVAVIPKSAMEYDIHNVVAGAITLTQPVYMGGAIRAMDGITHYASEIARASRNAAVQDVVYNVDEAYWLVVSLKEKCKLADSFVCLMDTFLYNVNAMYTEGVATQKDVLTVQVNQNQASIARVKVQNGLSLARMALNQMCGLPIDDVYELADGNLADEPTTMPPFSYNMQDVYANRQDLKALGHSISMFEQKEKLALSALLPKLAIVGAYSFSNPNTIDGFEKRFGGGFSIGATLTVPLWHWGGNTNRYKAAKTATNVQRLLLDEAREKVNLQVNQAKFKYEEAYKTYRMTLENQKKADENLRQAQLAYREGLLTPDDVVAAQTAWVQAQSERIDAQIGIELCNTYLSKVLGNLKY